LPGAGLLSVVVFVGCDWDCLKYFHFSTVFLFLALIDRSIFVVCFGEKIATCAWKCVFIFAKELNGPPMPLAVIRRPVADLPFEFVLSDAQSMVDGSGISTAETVVVTAKISAPGDALGTNPVLEVKSDPVATINAPYLGLIIGPPQQNN
jgi:hypothetical protein